MYSLAANLLLRANCIAILHYQSVQEKAREKNFIVSPGDRIATSL